MRSEKKAVKGSKGGNKYTIKQCKLFMFQLCFFSFQVHVQQQQLIQVRKTIVNFNYTRYTEL